MTGINASLCIFIRKNLEDHALGPLLRPCTKYNRTIYAHVWVIGNGSIRPRWHVPERGLWKGPLRRLLCRCVWSTVPSTNSCSYKYPCIPLFLSSYSPFSCLPCYFTQKTQLSRASGPARVLQGNIYGMVTFSIQWCPLGLFSFQTIKLTINKARAYRRIRSSRVRTMSATLGPIFVSSNTRRPNSKVCATGTTWSRPGIIHCRQEMQILSWPLMPQDSALWLLPRSLRKRKISLGKFYFSAFIIRTWMHINTKQLFHTLNSYIILLNY